VLSSSKGKSPLNKAYKITPADHISTREGIYGLFAIISGAA